MGSQFGGYGGGGGNGGFGVQYADGSGYYGSNPFNPMADGYGDQYGNGQNIGRAISQASLAANQLSSQNAQAGYYPQAMVQQAALALQAEQLRQQGQNQRLSEIAPLFAALFGASSKPAGFSSNFGQSVH